MSHVTLFLFICFCSRLCWSWKVLISILRLMKNYVRFQYVPWKMSVWVSFPLLRFTLVIRLRNFIWNWNTTTTNKEMVSHLNMSHGKMYDFVSFLKLTNFILKVIEIFQIFFIRKGIRGIGWKTEGGGGGGGGGGGSRFEWKGILKKKVL